MKNVLRTLDKAVSARLVKFTSENACVSIPSENKFSTEGSFCYVNKAPIEDLEVGAVFELPAGQLVSQLDKDGNVKTTKDGIVLAFYEES